MADISVIDGHADEALRELKPLEGQLVEVFGMEGNLVKSVKVQQEGADAEEVDIDGQVGRCVSWFEPESKYIIETFDGILAGIPEGNVREWIPPLASEGGFDLAWPAGAEATEYFGGMVCEELASKGYCVIQTMLSPEEREEAMEQAEEGREFTRMKQEVEMAYMGYDNLTKVAAMPHQDNEDQPDGVLEACNRQMTILGLLLTPLAPASMGFACHGRMNAMIRMAIDKNDEDELPSEALLDMDDAEEWSGHVEEFVRFRQRRTLCIINMIDNEGGDMWLYPKAGLSKKSVHLPLTANKIVVFRHDLMDYSYQAPGRSLALQTWILNDPGKFQQIKELSVTFGGPNTAGEVVVNPGPEVPDGPKASIMALCCRMPGEAWNPSQYWLMFGSGSDSVSQWPFNRWETDMYYEEGCDSNQTGKAYTCHGGFISQEQITQFDHEFFGMDYDEARSMLPGQRVVTEVGYQVLVASGFNKKSLAGRRIGTWLGDVGPDWSSFQTEWGKFHPDISPTMMLTSMSTACTSARIAHMFDLRGPISSYDTACSASLVAMNAAHLLMFDQDTPSLDNSEALVGGVNTLLGPGSFIGNCMATMLSHKGRSFTFNRSADGYQRGEGNAMLFVKLFQGDKAEEEERVCAMIGTATNQDGRSASLTAPNGPAQQAVIRKSMRFASINPNTVSIAECHGTGTALGDPIEVGALMAVMHQREFPLLKTSAKSNIAHLEAGAGTAGLSKCIMMINMATAPPNQHFNIINPHLTTDGFPVYFDSDCIDTSFSSLYCGVSSFGFGGTNSRADVYGFASKGHKAVIKFELPKISLPRVVPMGQPIYIVGTWTGFTEFQAMEGGRDGVYKCAVALSETRWEQFQLTTTAGDMTEVFHPLFANADETAQIVGPDYDGKDLNLLIDGRKDGVPAGTIYEIEFTWTDDKKTITWAPVGTESDLKVLGYDYEHKYYLTGSWRKWVGFEEMVRVGDGLYEGSFTVGFHHQEEFQIVRDRDKEQQAIYPVLKKSTAVHMPVLGPGPDGSGKNFLVKGPHHMVMTVKLCVTGGQVAVTLSSTALGERTLQDWDTWATSPATSYFTTGSFNGGGLTLMVPDSDTPGIHSCTVSLDAEGLAQFQIVANEDLDLLLYPDDDGQMRGPDPEGVNAWWIQGDSFANYNIKLDMTQSDRGAMVTWAQQQLAALT